MSNQIPTQKVEVVAGVVIERGGKYLLVQEKQPKAYGLWNLPGGKVDNGETLEQAAMREANEESGFTVKILDELLTLHQAAETPVLHAFSCKITGGELSFPEDEMLDAKWFAYDEVKAMSDKLRNKSYILGAIDALRRKRGNKNLLDSV